MADVREQRIYCAEQIVVPPELPVILKHYAKEVIRNKPGDIVDFSAKYFRSLLEKRGNCQLKCVAKEHEFSETVKQ